MIHHRCCAVKCCLARVNSGLCLQLGAALLIVYGLYLRSKLRTAVDHLPRHEAAKILRPEDSDLLGIARLSTFTVLGLLTTILLQMNLRDPRPTCPAIMAALCLMNIPISITACIVVVNPSIVRAKLDRFMMAGAMLAGLAVGAWFWLWQLPGCKRTWPQYACLCLLRGSDSSRGRLCNRRISLALFSWLADLPVLCLFPLLPGGIWA